METQGQNAKARGRGRTRSTEKLINNAQTQVTRRIKSNTPDLKTQISGLCVT
jgi:hypothetical protein